MLNTCIQLININFLYVGVWFWHCHFEKHLSWGMEAVFIVKNGGTAETSIRDPPSYMPPCVVSLNSRVQDFDASIGKQILE